MPRGFLRHSKEYVLLKVKIHSIYLSIFFAHSIRGFSSYFKYSLTFSFVSFVFVVFCYLFLTTSRRILKEYFILCTKDLIKIANLLTKYTIYIHKMPLTLFFLQSHHHSYFSSKQTKVGFITVCNLSTNRQIYITSYICSFLVNFFAFW